MRPGQATANDPLRSARAAELTSSLRSYAAERLPGIMVPARFVVLDALPTLPNGKIDRNRLPAPEAEQPAMLSPIPPRTATEARVAEIWQDVLRVSRVGVTSSFFEMGGDSLRAVQMMARVRAEFVTAISLRRLFERPTVAELASMIDSQPGAAADTAEGPMPGASGISLSISGTELEAEACLPADIRADGVSAAASPPYRSVLITGVTGFIGAFLLRQVLDSCAAEVSVLVRAADELDALTRIQRNGERFGTWRASDRARLVPVLGDLARPYLGVPKRSYERMADELDVIIHNGALSSFVLPYHRLKAVNVLGTQEVLRLAARRRLKPVHFISSLAVFPGHRDIKDFAEVELTDPDGVLGGYPQTKWVSDRMMSLARGRGLPVAIYRPGQITGASDTGACPEDLFVCAMMKGCIQLQQAPDPDMMVEMVPVDFVARAVAHVALSGRNLGEVFHLPSPRPQHWVQLIDLINECGYRLRRVSYHDWYRALAAAIDEGQDNALIPFMPLLGEDGPSEDLAYQNGSPHFDSAHLSAALANTGIACPPVGAQLLGTYLRYFRSTGYLDPASTGKDVGP